MSGIGHNLYTTKTFYNNLFVHCNRSKVVMKKDIYNRIDTKEERLTFMYPFCLFIFSKVDTLLGKKEKKSQEELLHQCRKFSISILIFMVFVILFIFANWKEQNSKGVLKENYILRPEHGEGKLEVTLHANIEEQDNHHNVIQQDIQLEVKERKYTKEEWLKECEKAKIYIEEHILKENVSFDKVTSSLYLMKKIPNKPIKITWDIGATKLIEEDGTIHNEKIEEASILTLNAKISYEKEEVIYPISIRILPKEWKREEWLQQKLLEAIEAAKQKSDTESKLVLPTKIDGNTVVFEEKVSNSSSMLLVLGLICIVTLWKGMDQEREKRKKAKNQELLLDYPELVNKITLLLGAGMTIKNAWGRIVWEYKQKAVKRYAYEEMLITWNELNNGITENTAYVNFGNRIQLLPYLKLSSLLAQNVRKGSNGLLELLEMESIEALEERKQIAKRLGEEAGTKLLFPMIIMLVIVFVIILVPAFISFGR